MCNTNANYLHRVSAAGDALGGATLEVHRIALGLALELMTKPIREMQPFRLLDLPGEIRNRIYQAVLCSFGPAPPLEVTAPKYQNIRYVSHSIETTLLRTCKQVHREAYDTMVKTNQFIRVTTIGIPMSILLPAGAPILTMDRAHTDQFKGYLLRLYIRPLDGGWIQEIPDADDEDSGPRFDFMLLRQDWDEFCTTLGQADVLIRDFSSCVHVHIHLNAYPPELPDYKASISEFFTQKNQEALLKPFHTYMAGFTSVKVTGAVDPKLAREIIATLGQPS
jgi:hypothetical protein